MASSQGESPDSPTLGFQERDGVLAANNGALSRDRDEVDGSMYSTQAISTEEQTSVGTKTVAVETEDSSRDMIASRILLLLMNARLPEDSD